VSRASRILALSSADITPHPAMRYPSAYCMFDLTNLPCELIVRTLNDPHRPHSIVDIHMRRSRSTVYGFHACPMSRQVRYSNGIWSTILVIWTLLPTTFRCRLVFVATGFTFCCRYCLGHSPKTACYCNVTYR
jgi:hypothetical protein